jgi:carbonic anhydrase/acetyltransferase-like protein (isoleucine patch superfamily)
MSRILPGIDDNDDERQVMDAPSVILPYDGVLPRVAEDAYVAPTAVIIGDVVIGAHSSLWFGVTARADVNEIRIGAGSNIQDGTVIHVASRGQGTYVGDEVTVGHAAVLHACTLEDRCFVGIKACVMDGARVESGAMVAAGALVTAGKLVRSGELWAGVPARRMRKLTAEEIEAIADSAGRYVQLAKSYLTAAGS